MGDKKLIAKPATTLLINEEGSFSAQTLDKHLMGRLPLPPVAVLMLKRRQSGCAAFPPAGSANTLQAGHQAQQHHSHPFPMGIPSSPAF